LVLDDLEEKERILEIERGALDHTVRRTHFGRGYGLVVRHNGMKA
jgi:hypothetical protein